MKFLNLTVLIAFSALFFTACKKDNNSFVRKKDLIVMNGAQVAPPNQSAANASMGVLYESKSKTLTYLVVWSGLTGTVTGIHLHGPADPSFAGPILQTLTPYSSSNTGGYPTGSSGSYRTSVFIDGVVLKEEELLAGKYYIDIHTSGTTAYNTAGEVRGQITFD